MKKKPSEKPGITEAGAIGKKCIDGDVLIDPSGKVFKYYKDGSQIEIDLTGGVSKFCSDGSQIEIHHDNTVDRWDKDDNYISIQPDSTVFKNKKLIK